MSFSSEERRADLFRLREKVVPWYCETEFEAWRLRRPWLLSAVTLSEDTLTNTARCVFYNH